MGILEDAGSAGEERFHVTLEQLEKSVRVPVADQVASHPSDAPPAGSDYDEQRRQLRLAGGM